MPTAVDQRLEQHQRSTDEEDAMMMDSPPPPFTYAAGYGSAHAPAAAAAAAMASVHAPAAWAASSASVLSASHPATPLRGGDNAPAHPTAASFAAPPCLTYLFRTPRGRTASASVPTSASYESFVRRLLEAAAARDVAGSPKGVAELGQQCHRHVSMCCSTTPKRAHVVVSVKTTAHAAAAGLGKSGDEEEEERRVRRRLCVPPCPDLEATTAIRPTDAAYVLHGGRVLGREEYRALVSSAAASSRGRRPNLGLRAGAGAGAEVHLTLRLRLLGGMADRQNRVGSKFGGGGVSSAQQSERERKERLRRLALESVDLARDPYLMRNHLGTYECKLCLTLHTNEGNYLAHTQGKKHQAGLARRAAMERRDRPRTLPAPLTKAGAGAAAAAGATNRVRIGRPGYQIVKSRDPETNQRCLSFELHYPELDDPDAVRPRHRFMSAYEQRVESPPDRRYQYLLVACDPYETVAFKVPNEPIDRGEGRFVTNWDGEGRRFTIAFYFLDPAPEEEGGREGGGKVGRTRVATN